MLKKVPMKVLVNVLNQLPQPQMSQCRFKKQMEVKQMKAFKV